MKTMRQIFARAKKEGRKLLTLDESFDALKAYKIPVAGYAVARNANEAARAAEKIGYPVVLKIISKKITHKTDVGGVILGLRSAEDVRTAFEKISKNMKRAKVRLESVLVQKMVDGGQQVIVGGKKDSQFGQTVVFGAGGIYVEAFEDVSVRVTPLTSKDAEEMIKETKVYKTLENFRGKMYDTDAVVDVLLKVSKLLDENQGVVELDVNPVVVLPKNMGAVAVDARIVLQ